MLDAGVGDEDRVELGFLDGGKGGSLVLNVGDDRPLLEGAKDVRQGRRMLSAPVETDDENRRPAVDLAEASRLNKYYKVEEGQNDIPQASQAWTKRSQRRRPRS